MTEYEAGYLQALKDTLITVRQMVNDLGSSPDGRVEMLGVVSLLDGLIKTKVQRHGDYVDRDAPDPLSGSF